MIDRATKEFKELLLIYITESHTIIFLMVFDG